uniref:transposase n=1 Tax=uncultured Polaribacter sp. TaxID=174711 RepID=UPI0026033442
LLCAPERAICLSKWDEKVRQAGFKSFNTIARTMSIHYQNILNYFDNRSTNASAESFNAKIIANYNEMIVNKSLISSIN